MKKLLLLLAFFSFQFAKAQTKDTTLILLEAEIAPEFEGGEEALFKFLNDNLNYPDSARKINMQAKVMVRFAIMNDGRTNHIKILSKTPEIFNTEVIRMIKSMPKWKPGMQGGKPVAVYYSLPVLFRLQ